MYAVFKTGGQQFRVTEGYQLKVDKIEKEAGEQIEFDDILLVGAEDSVKVGAPFVKGGKIIAKVIEHGRHKKIDVIKFKRRKHYRRQAGHRQWYTQLEITDIQGA